MGPLSAPPTAPPELRRAPRPPEPRRLLLAAFGDPGHAFPMIALGAGLAGRGHAVCLETSARWAPHVEAAGMTFAPAPEHAVFPTPGQPLQPYEQAEGFARDTRRLIARWKPDACVSDILTLAPALAAEMEGVPAATLVPHIFPHVPSGLPPYAVGARLPRTAAGAAFWHLARRLVDPALEEGRRQMNETRRRLGLPPRPYVHTGLSRELTLVATLPQLEYPREWPAWARVVGPLLWEPPAPPVAPPAGSGPVVLVAPSTSQDPEHALLRAALAGLAGEPVRVIGIHGGEPEGVTVPGNAVLVPWLSYAQAMPACDLVISHGGHGTLVRALSHSCPVVLCPAGGDMAENAARADWAGVGLRLPRRLLSPRTLRLAVRRVLEDPRLRDRAARAADWLAAHDPAALAAHELEAWLASAGRRGR